MIFEATTSQDHPRNAKSNMPGSSKMYPNQDSKQNVCGLPLLFEVKDMATTEDSLLEAGLHKRSSRCCKTSNLRPRTRRAFFTTSVVAITVVTFLYLTDVLLGATYLIPGFEQRDKPSPDWEIPNINGDASAMYPAELTHNVVPRQCHSHNDYWRHVPLYEALHFGCTSVEADIWFMDMNGEDDSDLYVGHSLRSLRHRRTLRSLYIDPLISILDTLNFNHVAGQYRGLFERAPDQSLVLLIDFKNNPELTFHALMDQLEPLRAKGYLTYHNGSGLVPGPLTIVATGDYPYSSILAQNSTHRDIFFDSPLGDLTLSATTTSQPAESGPEINDYQDYNTTTSLYASSSLRMVIGSPFPFLLPGSPYSWQLERIRSATRAAHARGLKVRWWDTPAWPRSRREKVWKVLMDEGADVLNVDDLRAARDWDGW